MVSFEDPTQVASDAGEVCPTCFGPLPRPGAPCPECDETVTGEGGPGTAEFTGPKQIADYRILRELGAGGMGTVFEAHETKMNRRVALKVLSRHLAPSEKAGIRFEQEAWIAGRLSHPNLVKVYECGTWEELSYFSMELVRGGSLADVISNMKRWGRDDRLGLELGSSEYVQWVIRMVVAAARGLDYAHREGVIHRDIKPVNLLLSRETKSVKIADFGLAFETDATQITSDGNVLGTLVYMAPEQILGDRELIDPRTDIYGLGVTLFQMLTLELPYQGKTQQLYLNAVLTAEARRPSKINERVSRDLEVVIGKALEKRREDRYESAAAFADDLDNVLHFRPIRARPPAATDRIWKWIRRRPMQAALIGVLVAGMPVFGILGISALQHRSQMRQQRVEKLLDDVRFISRREEHRKALDPLNEVLSLDPENVSALTNRAEAYVYLALEDGDASAAQRHQDRALADIDRLVELQTEHSWTYSFKAWALSKFERDEEAAAARELARRNRSAEPDVQDHYFEAHVAFTAGDYERAVELFSEVLAVRSGSVDPLYYRALAYEELDRLDSAIEDLRVSAALNPDDFMIQYTLGQLSTRDGRLEEGERYARRALDLAPESEHVLDGLADNFMEQGREAAYAGDVAMARNKFEEAENAARRSLELRPDLPWANLNLGASLMEQNRLLEAPDPVLTDEAFERYEAALAIMRGNPEQAGDRAYVVALNNLCDARIQAGRPEDALSVCTEVTELWPENPDPFYNLAGVYALLGRTDEAMAALERDFQLGDRDWAYLADDRWFESLREEERFRSLLRRMQDGGGS